MTSAGHESFVHSKATQAGSRLHGESVPERARFDPSTGMASVQRDLFTQPGLRFLTHSGSHYSFSSARPYDINIFHW